MNFLSILLRRNVFVFNVRLHNLPLLLHSHISVQMFDLKVRILSVLIDLSSQWVLEVCHLDFQLILNSVIDELRQISLLTVRKLPLVKSSNWIFDIWVVQGIQMLRVDRVSVLNHLERLIDGIFVPDVWEFWRVKLRFQKRSPFRWSWWLIVVINLIRKLSFLFWKEPSRWLI